jgi:cytochrome c553
MKIISRILACAAASFSLALAPAIAVADTEPSNPTGHGDSTCACCHGREHRGPAPAAKAAASKPAANTSAASTEVPEWVRQIWVAP